MTKQVKSLECLVRDRRATGSSLTGGIVCALEQATLIPAKYCSTQEDQPDMT